jgi:hypothetical protein
MKQEIPEDVCLECGQIIGMGLDPVEKLSKDLRETARKATREEASHVVDLYYLQQEKRIAIGNQLRTLEAAGHSTELLSHFYMQFATLEKQAAAALGEWSLSTEVGRWSRETLGIGPVLAAGLMAYIDMQRCPTVGHIWRYGGYDPTLEWLGTKKATELVDQVVEKGVRPTMDDIELIAVMVNRSADSILALARTEDENPDEEPSQLIPTRAKLIAALARRPYNAKLKTMFWKIGDSFVKTSGRPNGFYGRLYRQRKAIEIAKNNSRDFAELAKETLESRNIQDAKLKATYEDGRLPDGRIDLRARRWAVKIFLSHWWEVAWEELHPGEKAVLPFAQEHLGHVDRIERPH